MSSIELIGWVSGICFAVCGAPQLIQCYRQGHARGVNPYFMALWLIGELGSIVYVYYTHGVDLPLFFNYFMNIVFIAGIIKYMISPNNCTK